MKPGLAAVASAVSVAIGNLSFSVPSAATEQSDAELAAVVVTATKRDTSLQDTDISITVLDAKQIDQARLRDIRRVDDLVPNVQFNESGQLSNVFITIRGVESNPFIVNRAAVYIDGIPFRELTNAVLNHVESIEVLRGPQGALYGANSESGLILVRSRAPSATPEGELRVTGSSYSGTGGVDLDGYYSQALIDDQLTGSISAKYSDEASYRRNRAAGVDEPGNIGQQFVQGRLRWTPNDQLTVNATAYLLNINAPGMFDQDFFPVDRVLYDTGYGTYNGGGVSGPHNFFHDAPARTDEREHVAGLSARYDLGSGTIDAAFSYRRDASNARGLDFDFSALPTAAGQEKQVESVWHGELRYASPDKRPFQYIAGIAMYRDAEKNTKATFIGPGSLDSYIAAPTQTRQLRDFSVFSTASYTPVSMPKLTLGAGLRLDHAKQASRQQAGDLDLGFGSVIHYTDATLHSTDKAVLPRLSARYEPTDDTTLFATISKGYIPGGFNLTATQEGVTDSDILRYRPETMWSYETGVKWRTADHKLRLSGAVFYIESTNWQEIRVLTDEQGRPISSDFIGSSASMDSKGVELEVSYEPMKRLQLSGNIGVANAKYKYLFNGQENLAGNRVKLVPEYDAMLAARYGLPQGFYGRVELDFTGKIQLDEMNRIAQPAVTVVNLQAGYETDRWSTRLLVENLTNKRRFSGLVFENLAFGTDGNFYGPLDAPRVLGVEVAMRF
jgi:iron complex outermembrane recepter protein